MIKDKGDSRGIQRGGTRWRSRKGENENDISSGESEKRKC